MSFGAVDDARAKEANPTVNYGGATRLGGDGDQGLHVESHLRSVLSGIRHTVRRRSCASTWSATAAWTGRGRRGVLGPRLVGLPRFSARSVATHSPRACSLEFPRRFVDTCRLSVMLGREGCLSMSKIPPYSLEFRQEAVRLLRSSGRSIPQLAEAVMAGLWSGHPRRTKSGILGVLPSIVAVARSGDHVVVRSGGDRELAVGVPAVDLRDGERVARVEVLEGVREGQSVTGWSVYNSRSSTRKRRPPGWATSGRPASGTPRCRLAVGVPRRRQHGDLQRLPAPARLVAVQARRRSASRDGRGSLTPTRP